MNGKSIVLDTNIVLYFLNGDVKIRRFFNEYDPIISFITELELLSAQEMTMDEKRLIQKLLKEITIVKYSDKHKEDIVKLRSNKKLKLPDAIIVALAMTLDLPIVTADKTLRNIHGVKMMFYDIALER